jgi:hypothetical protein
LGSSACAFPPVEVRRSSKDAIATLDTSATMYLRSLLDKLYSSNRHCAV